MSSRAVYHGEVPAAAPCGAIEKILDALEAERARLGLRSAPPAQQPGPEPEPKPARGAHWSTAAPDLFWQAVAELNWSLASHEVIPEGEVPRRLAAATKVMPVEAFAEWMDYVVGELAAECPAIAEWSMPSRYALVALGRDAAKCAALSPSLLTFMAGELQELDLDRAL